jgi:hypothetical protein
VHTLRHTRKHSGLSTQAEHMVLLRVGSHDGPILTLRYATCSKYSITPSQEVGRIPRRQQRVGSDEAICSCNAGGGFCAVRQAQLAAHPFGCSRGKPWGHLSTCEESAKPTQALGGVGRFRFSPLWGGPGEGWQCHQDRPSQLGSALWRHLPGQECTEVRWALAAMVRTGL